MKYVWSDDDREFVIAVAEMWADGQTLAHIAATLDGRYDTRSIYKLRYRLLNLGLRFARAGRLVWTATGDVLRPDELTVEAA